MLLLQIMACHRTVEAAVSWQDRIHLSLAVLKSQGSMLSLLMHADAAD